MSKSYRHRVLRIFLLIIAGAVLPFPVAAIDALSEEASTMEQQMVKLQPLENKIDLRTAPLRHPGKTLQAKSASAIVSIKQPPQKIQSSSLGTAGESAQTNTGVAAIDAGLAFLRKNQNENGSWSRYGDASAMPDTLAVLDMFATLGLSSDTAYANGIAWLGATFPESSGLAAQKFSTLARNGEDVTYPFESIAQRINDADSGFGYNRKYASDVSTTASALEALTASGYQDAGENPDFTKISALFFLLNNQNSNGGWGENAKDQPRILSTCAALNALFSYRTSSLQGPNQEFAIKDYVAAGLAYLKNTQATDGAWNNNLLETALAYDTLHRYAAPLANEEAAFQYLQKAQGTDGSFGNGSAYVSAKTLGALSHRLLATQPDLVITDISAADASLVNYKPAAFSVTIKNIGRRVVSSARLYDFTANYNWNPAGYDLGALGINVAPGEQFTLTLEYDATGQFLGDVEFKFYVEAEGEANYENNWLAKVFAFASEPSGKPALPVYFIAQKYDIDGAPALNIRWPVQSDPNRAAYVMAYREKGQSAWRFVYLLPSWNGAFISPFKEGVTYEITAGALYQDGSTVTHFSENFTEVTMSANPSLYTGNVSGRVTFNEKPLPNIFTFAYGSGGRADQNGNVFYNNVANGTTAAWVYGGQYDGIVTKFPVPIDNTTSGVRIFTRFAKDTQPPRIITFEIQSQLNNVIKNQSVVKLYLHAEDDKGFFEGDFFYFEPRTNEWVYIKTAPAEFGYSISTPWAIGDNLLGPGYRVRAIARDWTGNNSLPAEWGPFEIIPGANAPPKITLLEPDGAGDQADASFAITWEDSDPDSSAVISLFYDTNATGEDGALIANNISEDSAINSYLWNTSSIAQGSYYIYALIDDGANKVTSYSIGPVAIAHAPALAAPSAPRDLAGISTHPAIARLSWEAPLATGDSPLTGYRIERKTSLQTSFAVIVSNTKNTTTMFVDTELAPSASYEYRVRALSGARESEPSNIAQVRTHDPLFGSSIFDEALRAPWTDASSARVAILKPAIDQAASGFNSIKVTYKSVSGDYSLTHPNGFDTSGGIALVFSLLAATSTPTADFRVKVYDASNTLIGQRNLGAYLPVSNFALNQWYSVAIPLTRLASVDKVISRISFTSKHEGVFYFDAIGFTGTFKVPPPAITILDPDGAGDLADTFYTIRWNDVYEEGDARVSLYYDKNNAGADGKLIAANISEDKETDAFVWRTTLLAARTYYVYAVMSYPGGAQVSYSPGRVTVVKHAQQPNVFNVFTDGVENGWGTATKNIAGFSPASQEEVFAGSASLMAMYLAKGTLDFTRTTSSIDAIGKTNLKFSILAKTSVSASAITVNLINANGAALAAVSLKNYGVTALQANTWYSYEIPLVDLGLANNLIQTIRFKSLEPATLFLDEIKIE